jgi:hypothetical protein
MQAFGCFLGGSFSQRQDMREPPDVCGRAPKLSAPLSNTDLPKLDFMTGLIRLPNSPKLAKARRLLRTEPLVSPSSGNGLDQMLVS